MNINLRPLRNVTSDIPLQEQKKFRPSIFKQFLPLFFVAAFLPIGLAVVLNPEGLTTVFTRAAKSPELRLWLEPENIRINVGQPVILSLMAEFDDETKLIPTMTADVVSDQSIEIVPSKVSYTKPFRGRLKIAEVTVTPTSNGTFSVNIPTESVTTTLQEAVNIITGPANIEVTN